VILFEKILVTEIRTALKLYCIDNETETYKDIISKSHNQIDCNVDNIELLLGCSENDLCEYLLN